MNKLAFGTALAVLATTLPATAQAQKLNAPVIAVVDTARVFRDCNACKTAQATLQQQLDGLRARAQQLGQPLQTEEQSLTTAVQALNGKAPDPALQQRIQAFQTKQNTASQELQGRQATLERNRQYVAQQIQQKLEPIFNQVMQTRGATVLLDEGATLAHASSLDVTNDVLASLNQQLPSVSTTAPAAPPQQQQPQGR